jgi:hypothetical protein
LIPLADIESLIAQAPLGAGYRFELLKQAQIAELVGCISQWFPDISVGGASCYLRRQFYERRAYLADGPVRDVVVLLLKRADELCGMFSCKLDRETQSAYAELGVAAPAHRGAHLARAGITFTEALARRLGVGFIYGMATLKNPYAQRAFEQEGWQLIGITPGYDRELISPGVIKRVYEAVYAKVLASEASILRPERGNLTRRTQSFFDWIFASDH